MDELSIPKNNLFEIEKNNMIEQKNKTKLTRNNRNFILKPLFLILLYFSNNSFAQTGTSANPFTALGMAQNITTNGIYYFNLSGTTFSTYVISGGWVQVAFDYGNGVGNLPQVTTLTNTSRGILNPTVLSKLGSATKVKINSNYGSFEITSSNATHVSRVVNNQCLNTGSNDNGLIASWSGTTANLGSGCNSNSDNGLHQRIYHAACNNTGLHWIPLSNMQTLSNPTEIPAASYMQLWVQAPLVAVVSGPVINTQPSVSTQNVCLNGSTAALSVSATGTATLNYQWYKNSSASNVGGTLISGASNSTYTPLSTTVETAYYYVVITNAISSVTSAVSGSVIINALVTTSNAGPDQTGISTCGLTSATLAANGPTTGVGVWSIVSGSGGTIATPSISTSNFSGVSGNSYTLRWTITNGGCVSSDDVVITLNARPIPIISATGCGSPKTLTSSSATSYLWSPNNETTNSIAVSFSGTYSLTTTNAVGCTSNPVSSIVNITPVPIAGTLSGTQAICTVGTTLFTSNGNAGGTWSSSATGIASVNASSGLVTGVSTGTATITYTIAASGGCSAVSSTRTVSVTTATNAGTLSGTQAICSNGSVTFTTNGNTGGTWTSSATGIATINASLGLIAPVSPGTTTITYTVTGTGGCANTSATRTATITSAPNAGVLSGNQAICSNANATFASDGNAGGTWTSNATSIATVNASTGLVSAVANATGTATITYTVTGTGGCSNATATRAITVTAIPVITVQPSTTVQNVCQNGVSVARFVTASGGGLTYQWYQNSVSNNTSGTLIVGANVASYTPPSSAVGTYYYYCVVSGTCTPAITSNVSGAVNINAPATVSNAGADQTGSTTCGLTNIALTGNNPSTGSGIWSIISGSGGTISIPTSATSNFSGIAGNLYTLRWTITNGGCVSMDDVQITFNTIPIDATLVASNKVVEILVVAGGGGAGFFRGGGGGGGGYISVPSFSVIGGSSTAITVGTGGAPGYNNSGTGVHAISGTNSSFGSTYIAIGGGGGGSYGGAQQNGYTGGSGGGGANQSSSANTGYGGSNTASQGNVGGNSRCGGGGEVSGGGGGGAGGSGAGGSSGGCGTCSNRPFNPGAGGAGIQNSITGTAIWYAGGGGGGGLGGNCTSGSNISATNGNGGGQSSYGGGGQCKVASNNFTAESGGQGIVVVKYLGTPAATGGTITQVGGYTIHTFTASGTFALSGSTSSAIVPNQTRCGQGTVTFTSTTTAGLTLDWYDASTGGTLLSSGTSSYTTPIISSNTSYYVVARNTATGCISANRLAVTATITGGSTISSNQSVCVGTSPSNIVLTSAGSAFQWQSSTDNNTFTNMSGQINGTLTGASIGNLFASMYYRAIVTNGSCVGNSPVHTITLTNPTLTSTPVTGNIIWRGNTSSDWTTLSNWNQYNGLNFIAASALPVAASNVIIPSNSACITNQPSILTNTANVNNLIIENGASLTATTGTVNISGNWINNGTFTSGTGTVNFNGTIAQSIGGANSSTFNNLIVNKNSSAITLLKPTTIAGTLTMTLGNIISSNSNLLTIGTSTSAVGSLNWSAGSVVGPLKRYYSVSSNSTTAAGIFPVGTATNNRYAQINFTTNPSVGGTITAEYIPGVCPIAYQGLPATINGGLINNYEDEGYWSITPSGGNLNSTTYSLILHGKNLSTVSNLSTLRIIKSSNHSTWNDNTAGDGNHITPTGSNSDFTIGATGMLGFSWFNIGSNNTNPLPIELIDFKATCKDHNVKINWSTGSEQNSSKFILEKSRDLITWQLVNEKSAAGNSNYYIEYSNTDPNPFAGISYYQLRQIDFNGYESKYGPISISCSSSENKYILFPNPTSGSFNVELINSTEDIITCDINDLSGKLIYQVKHLISQGTTLLNFENLELQKGIYIFQIKGNNSTWVSQMFTVY